MIRKHAIFFKYSNLSNEADVVTARSYHIPWHAFYSSRPSLPLQRSAPFTSGLSLSPGVSSQKCQNINISGSGPQVIMLRAGDQILQLPPLRVQFWVRCHTIFQSCPAGLRLGCPQGNLLDNVPLFRLLAFPGSLPSPLRCSLDHLQIKLHACQPLFQSLLLGDSKLS